MGLHFGDSLMVAFVGMLVVFSGLTLLIMLIKIMNLLTSLLNRNAQRTEARPISVQSNQTLPPNSPNQIRSAKIRVR